MAKKTATLTGALDRPDSLGVMAGAQPKPVPAMDTRVQLLQRSYYVTAEHHRALRLAALERQDTAGGKADASAVLRDILDAWLKR